MSESQKREAKRLVEILIEKGVIERDYHGQYHKQIFIIPLFTEEDLLNKLTEAITTYQGELNASQITIKVGEDKITKTGLHCYNCGENTREEIRKANGMYYYRCQHCIDTADPNEPEPCPKCGCKAHERIVASGIHNDKGIAKLHRDLNNPLRPEFESYVCLNCGHKYYTKAFIVYSATKTVRDLGKKKV